MQNRVYVATRKGLFTLERDAGGTWAVNGAEFLGDAVTSVLCDDRDGTLYAALRLGHFGVKLHRSEDAGKSWQECAAPHFAAEESADDKSPSVDQIWCLEAGGPDQAGLLWAGTLPGGLFKSLDRGATWELNETLWNRPEREHWFGGGYDDPGIHSICVDPRDANRLTVGVSCGGLWVSTDGGATWKTSSKGMYAEYMPPDRRDDPAIQDPHRVVQCPASPDAFWIQHHNGVFRSTDGAATWADVPNVKPSVFGFAVAVHPHDPQTAWFVPAIKDERRVPVDGKFVVARTRDGGAGFEVLSKGLPGEQSYDLVYRHGLDVDQSGERLVMGSTTGNLWVSEDGGDSWTAVSTHLPPLYQVRFA